MAAPDFVPVDPTQRVRRYASPPHRKGGWSATRPGDLPSGQPDGVGLGSQGPDQGYVYKLIPLFDDQLHLGGVAHEDAMAGCVGVALKRAAFYGRAPVVHDLRMALTLFGFLDADAPADLVASRAAWFAGIGHGHHYGQQRELVDRVPVATLATTPDALEAAYRRDWTANLATAD